MAEHIKEGVTTEDIDRWVYEETTRRGAIPAPLNYEGFPKSVCTSIDEVVCHGIPDPKRVLKNGDIINVDCSTILNGYYSDSSRMFCIGDVSPEKKRLVEIARQSLEVGLKEVKPWNFLGDMGSAIHDFVRENGYSVVREIGGHGIGLEFHEEPWVSYVSEKGNRDADGSWHDVHHRADVNMGKPDVFVDEDDDWTVYTEDGLPSAQWGDPGIGYRGRIRDHLLLIFLVKKRHTELFTKGKSMRCAVFQLPDPIQGEFQWSPLSLYSGFLS